MPRVYINVEGFEYLDHKRAVTAEEFAEKFGIKITTARSWLSKWTRREYLQYVPLDTSVKGSSGKYRIGKKEWTDLYYDETV